MRLDIWSSGCHCPWWRHQMESFSALLVLCARNSPVTGEFPSQRPVTRSLNVFFDLRLNKRLSKQSWGWWFETPSLSLWRHRNALTRSSPPCTQGKPAPIGASVWTKHHPGFTWPENDGRACTTAATKLPHEASGYIVEDENIVVVTAGIRFKVKVIKLQLHHLEGKMENIN